MTDGPISRLEKAREFFVREIIECERIQNENIASNANLNIEIAKHREVLAEFDRAIARLRETS